MRLNKEQKDNLMKKYGVNRIWSFSRLNTFHNCMQEYDHLYLRHDIPRSDNVYTVMGSETHDLVEGLTKGEFSLEDTSKKWKEFVQEWEGDPNSLQFDTAKIKQSYLGNLNHYFEHTDLLAQGTKVLTEQPVMTKVGGTSKEPHYLFVGYIDTEYLDEDGNVVLVDYKTSSKSSFSKAKLPEKSMQLMLYATGIHQQNHIPYEKIKARFDMMKYVLVHYKQENGKWNTSVQERAQWVSKMAKKLETKLRKAGIGNDEAHKLIQIASVANNMECLPKVVQEQFYITNYFIELDINEENCNKLLADIERQCNGVLEFEKLTKEERDSYSEVNNQYNPDNYYDKKLCAWHTSDKFKEQEESLTGILQPEFGADVSNNDLDLFGNENELEALFS